MNHTEIELSNVREVAVETHSTLMNDPWMYSEAEWCEVSTKHVADVARAANAIQKIARLVSNSAQEPSLTGAKPLDQDTHTGLLQAAEIIGKYLGDLAESMAKTDTMLQAARKSGHE
jgi:hypothetical protein